MSRAPRSPRRLVFASSAITALLTGFWLAGTVTRAALGDLDPTFGLGGKVNTSFPGGLDTAADVAIQTDGKILIAGSSGSDFLLVRYNSNGSLDATFGTGGVVITDFPVGQGGLANALAIQTDGKIVLAGSASDPITLRSTFALARYNTNGTLDITFDSDGRVSTSLPNSHGTANDLVIQTDGKLVAVGTSTDATTFNSVFAVVRYNTDGTPDSSFDGDGIALADFAGVTFESGNAAALQTDGKILAGGLGSSSFALARFTTTGGLDNSFDGDGKVTTAFGGSFEELEALAVQSDGRIVAAGQTALSVASEDNFALARYNTDGSLDMSFDTDGKVITDFGLVDAATGVVIQTDGRIVAVGRAGTIAAGSFFAAARYNTNGTLDNSFDMDGRVLTDMSGGRFGLGAADVALQTDGRIVATGDANISGQRDFGTIRYNTDGSLDTAFDLDGIVITDFPFNEDAVNALLQQSDGKIVAVGGASFQIRIIDTQDPNFQLARYNTNGTLDTSFGVAGLVTTDFGTYGDDFAFAGALQTDGRIVAVGQVGAQFSQIGSADTAVGLVRYNTDGSPDMSFDGDGRVTTEFGATHDTALAVAIQSDGKIVVAGTNSSDFILARYNTNGSLDTTGFGTGGKVTTDFSGAADTANAIVIQGDGKIVVAGSAGADFALARYNTDGSLDMTGFGTGGKVTTDFGASDNLAELVLQTDGKLVAAGASSSGSASDFALARYNTDGTLDMTGFGSGGKVTTDFAGAFDSAAGLALQADGKLVAAGLTFPTAAPTPAAASFFALARYDSNGTLDSSFGTGGRVTTDFFGVENLANAVLVQGDGKIVAGGFANNGTSRDFALARYEGQIATPSPSPVTIQFDAANVNTNEGTHNVIVTLSRSGGSAGVVTVDYATSDGTATQRTDYTIFAGRVSFAAGETSKTFTLLVNDDNYVEGNELFNVALSNVTGGAVLGALSNATVTIVDNDSTNPPTSNVIDDTDNFVRQHYHDFLAREGDSGGIGYWSNEINSCGADQTCVLRRRLIVSDAFFVETEYQMTGGFLVLVYQAALNHYPNYSEYMSDRVKLIAGTNLSMSRSDFLNSFVQRPEFTTLYPPTITPTQYVDALNANAGGALTPAERDALITGLTNASETRASVLGKVAENATFIENQYNGVFIQSLYFHYLRRQPEEGGFDFWLGKINGFPPHSLAGQHSLVCAFLTSREYQERFSSLISRTNSNCEPG